MINNLDILKGFNRQNELEEIIEKELENYQNEYSDSFDHEEMTDYAPYGDTDVPVQTYITDESIERCSELFKEDFDMDTFLHNYLAENEDFQNLIYGILRKRNLIK